MGSIHLGLAVCAVLLCASSSKGEVRYGGGGVAARASARQGGTVAARASYGGGGGLASGAVQVPSGMMACRRGNAGRPSSAMSAFGGGRGPAAWSGVSHADAPVVVQDPNIPPARYGFYPSASQPSHNVRKSPTYQPAPAASASHEPPMAMIEDEYRATIAPVPQESFGAGHDRVIAHGPIGDPALTASAGGGGGGSLMNLFLGGDGGGGHNRDQGGKPADKRGNGK